MGIEKHANSTPKVGLAAMRAQQASHKSELIVKDKDDPGNGQQGLSTPVQVVDVDDLRSVDAISESLASEDLEGAFGRDSSSRTVATSAYGSLQRDTSSRLKTSFVDSNIVEIGNGSAVDDDAREYRTGIPIVQRDDDDDDDDDDDRFTVKSSISRPKYVKSEYHPRTYDNGSDNRKQIIARVNPRREFDEMQSRIQKERRLWSKKDGNTRDSKGKRRYNTYQEQYRKSSEEHDRLLSMQESQDRWDEELSLLEQELDFLEESIERAGEVLGEQIGTVLEGKQKRCEEACERIKKKYESASAVRAKTGEAIPSMIEYQTDIVMKRVLESALAKSGDFHSDLDILVARAKSESLLQKLNHVITMVYSKGSTKEPRLIRKRDLLATFLVLILALVLGIFLRIWQKVG